MTVRVMTMFSKSLPVSAVLLAAITVSSCTSIPMPSWIATSGPSKTRITESVQKNNNGLTIVDLSPSITDRMAKLKRKYMFSEYFSSKSQQNLIGVGDVLDITIYEAPPALLFGGTDTLTGNGVKAVNLPQQVVTQSGSVNIPFVGGVRALGRSTSQIESSIVNGLKGKANQPQAIVKLAAYNAAAVTVVGEVSNSLRMPLTPRGERLLDALASAGGQKQPISKTSVQLSRGGTSLTMALDAIIKDPKQNIYLQSGDVITLLNQPLSLSVLGATGKNEELNFESQGISLAQALARVGGLQDSRANVKGVFIFRFEDAEILGDTINTAKNNVNPLRREDGKLPVVYKVDMSDPATFFVAQNFVMKDKDILYVSNAASNELNKFLSILSSSIFTLNGINGFQ